MQKIINITYKCDCCGKEFKRNEELVKEHEEKCFKNKNILDKWNNSQITLKELLDYYISDNCYCEENKEQAINLLNNYNISITKSALLYIINKYSEEDFKDGIFSKNKQVLDKITNNNLIEVTFKTTKNEKKSYLKMPDFILNSLIPYIMKFNNIDPYIIKAKNIIPLEKLNSIINRNSNECYEIKNGNHKTQKLVAYFSNKTILTSDNLLYFPSKLIDHFQIIINNEGNTELIANLENNEGNKINKLICILY